MIKSIAQHLCCILVYSCSVKRWINYPIQINRKLKIFFQHISKALYCLSVCI